MGVAAGQSELCAHTTHVPSGAQTLPVCDAQSAFAVHWTHVELVVSHTGAAAEQLELLVQPGRHVKVCGLQMGAAWPQSELSRHATQVPVPA